MKTSAAGPLALAHALAALAIALWAASAPAQQRPAPNVNDIDRALLRPLLLDDRAAMRRYMAALPEGMYRVYQVQGQGKFYLDEGHDVIKDGLRAGRKWEPEMYEYFQKHARPGTTVIDVGAHIGTHTLELAALVGKEGRVYAFEPQKKIFRELVYNLRLNGVTNTVPLRYAIGRAADVIEMSPAVKGNEGGTPVGHGGDRAELRALDSFPWRNVSLIKIDVEGYEEEVLAGARLTLARNRPAVVVEIQGGNIYERATPAIRAKIDHTRNMLAGWGYKVQRISDDDYLALPESPHAVAPAH
jgi:FkbM family methyltransferase